MKKINFLKSLSPENGPALKRLWTGHESGMCKSIFTLLLFLFALGVGNVWGGVSLTYSDFDGKGASGGAEFSLESSGITFYSSKGRGNTSYVQLMSGSTFTVSSSAAITKIEITCTANNNSDYGPAKLSLKSGQNGSYSYSGKVGTWTGSSTSISFSLSAQARFTAIVVTGGAASYTVVWTINPAAGGSLSATSGTSTTVTPNSAYTYGSPAYTVTSGTAEVSQSTNTFTATPTANCSIRINMVEKTKYILNYHDGSGDGTKSNVYEGTNLITALGTPAASCDATSTTFVGWTTTEIATKTDTKPTLVSADAVVNSTTAAAKYYAVYAKSNTGSWSLTSIDKLNNSSGYAGYNGSHTASGISYTSNQVMAQSSTIQFQSSAGYMYNTTAMSADITSIVITSSSANWSVYTSSSSISSTPASGAISISSSGNTRTFTISATGHKYFHIKGGSNTPQATNITVNYGTTKEYVTTCCTPLGSINGSVNLNHKSLTCYLVIYNTSKVIFADRQSLKT